MDNTTDHLKSLVSVPTELEASVIVSLLEDHGIKAKAVGGYTSGFKAEAPGLVDVVVMNDDLEQASAVLRGIEEAEPGANQTETMADEIADLSDECLPDNRSPDNRSSRRLIILFGLALLVLSSLVTMVIVAGNDFAWPGTR